MSGHTLQVVIINHSVVFAVDCDEPRTAECRTFAGGCLVAEQADGCDERGISFAEYLSADRTPLADGMPITVEWDIQEECYTWAPAPESTSDGAR